MAQTFNYATTGTEIVTDALFKVGAAQEGEAVPSEQMSRGLRQLNRLVKFIQSKEGRHLWRRDEVLLFLNPSQSRYRLGPSDLDAEWCLEENFTSTNLNGSAAVGDTSLTLDSTSGMRAGDRFGLEMSDTTRDWMAITSVDSATTVTVPALTGTANDNASVYSYTTSTSEVIKVSTLANGDHAAGVTALEVDSTTGSSTGDRLSYVDEDGNTVFTKITTVTDGDTFAVPATAAAIDDNALINIYTTTSNQASISTKLNGAVTAADETIVVDQTTGMVPDGVLSVVLTDGSTAWMTTERVVSSTVLAIPPISGAASDNATVTFYPIKPPRPLRVLHVRRKGDGEDIPIDIEAQEDYRDQPLKSTTGTPVFITYKPTLTEGRLEVWQTPSSAKTYLGLTVERPFEDFDAAANAPDFPQEWYDPLVWMLAQRLESEYRVIDPARLQNILQMSQTMWSWVNDFDDDTGSIYLMPDYGP